MVRVTYEQFGSSKRLFATVVFMDCINYSTILRFNSRDSITAIG